MTSVAFPTVAARTSIAERLNLNERQRQALDITGDGIIAAGAGTGKTKTLTALVCRDLVEDGLAPEQVAVVTFTRAAAANLIGRVTEQLAALGDGETPDIAGLYVSTIDALSSRILREYALDAGLSPGFAVGDERAMLPLRQDAWETALQGAEREDLLTLGKLLDPHEGQLFGEVDRAHETLRLIGSDPATIPDPVSVGVTADEREDLLECLEFLLAHPAAQSKTVQTKLAQDHAAVSVADYAAFSTRKYGKVKDEFAVELTPVVERLTDYRQALIDVDSLPYRRAAARLLRAYAQAYAERKHTAEVLDFTDLAVRAQLMLAGKASAFAGFKRVYVDEAQDTNPMQLALLRAALAPDGRMLVVGDALQSIYSFRRADVAGFRAQAAAATERVELAENYRSQPSVMAPINAICSRVPELRDDLIVMEARAEQHDPDPDEHPSVEVIGVLDEEAVPTRETEAHLVAAHVLATRTRLGMRNSDICVLCAANKEASAYADAFRDLGVPALLIQRRGLMEREESKDLLAYLRLLADPDDEAALLRVLSSPFAGLSDMELYRMCAHRPEAGPREDGRPQLVALLPRLDQFAPAFSARFAAHRALVGRTGVADLARRAVEDHSYLLALEVTDPTGALRRNVEKLISRLAIMEREQHGPALEVILEALTRELEAGIDEGQDATLPPDIDAVRVMTVHNSKGDEFPLVVVGRLSKKRNAERAKVWVDGQGQLGFVVGKDAADSVAAAAKEQRGVVTEEERRRLIYVALTRAERHLVIAASAKLNQDGSGSWQGDARWLLHQSDGCVAELDPSLLHIRDSDAVVVVEGEAVRGEMPAPASVRVMRLRPGADSGSVRGLGHGGSGVAAQATGRAGNAGAGAAGEVVPEERAPIPLPLAGDTLSYTNLTAWRRCSLRRHLEHDLGLRPAGREPSDQADWDGSRARQFGIEFHELLKRADWSVGLSPSLIDRGRFGPDTTRARVVLQRLADHPLAARLRAASLISDVRAERRFVVRLGGYLLTGVLDISTHEEGARSAGTTAPSRKALVIDWKTGADEELVFAEDYALQRRLYALAALRAPNAVDSVDVLTVHLDGEDVEVETETYGRDRVSELAEELAAAVGGVLDGPVVAAASSEQPFCRDCPGCERVCPVSAFSQSM